MMLYLGKGIRSACAVQLNGDRCKTDFPSDDNISLPTAIQANERLQWVNLLLEVISAPALSRERYAVSVGPCSRKS
jgi:hypothetical protein